MSFFLLVKYLHILLAITAVGFNISYGIWIARAAKDPTHLSYTLRRIKFLDDRLTNPAYALLLVTGITMVLLTNLSLTTFWIAAALVLYVIVALLGLGVYTPTLRDQIRVLEAEGADSPEYRRLSARGSMVGILTAIPVLVIVFLMVVKPTI